MPRDGGSQEQEQRCRERRGPDASAGPHHAAGAQVENTIGATSSAGPWLDATRSPNTMSTVPESPALAVVAIEVARRLGVRLSGVGMPGHFVVGDPDDPTWFADPFHGRTGLLPSDCREMLEGMGITRWSDRFLEPTPNRLIIARMLNNLKASCELRQDGVRLALVMQARQALPEFAAEGDDALQALAILN